MALRGLVIQEFWGFKNSSKQPTAKSSHLEGARNASMELWLVHRGRSPTVWKNLVPYLFSTYYDGKFFKILRSTSEKVTVNVVEKGSRNKIIKDFGSMHPPSTIGKREYLEESK